MKYVALRDFDNFKKGDTIPAEFVEGRLIRGKKIGLADGSIESPKTVETKEEIITEVTEVVEVQETVELVEEILTEDSSDVKVEIKEEDIPEVKEIPKETKKAKK